MAKMKIAIISYGKGGMLHYALDLASILYIKFEVTLFTNENIEEYSIQNKIKVISAINLGDFGSAKKILREYPNFDIYHITAFHPSLYSILFAKQINKLVYTMHDCNIHPYGFSYKKLKFLIVYNKFFLNLLLKRMNRIVCLSAFVAGQATQKFKIVSGIIRLPNYSEKFSQKSVIKSKINNMNLNILIFGGIEKYKGIDKVVDFIEYVDKNNIKDIQITIAGRVAKSYVEVFEKLKNTTIVNRYILDSEISDFFTEADFLLAPYTEVSQSGVVSLAIDFKLPVIASDIGSFSEYIKPHAGILLEDINPENIIKAIHNWKEKNRSYLVNKELSKEIQLEKYSNIYFKMHNKLNGAH